ncbi:MAG: efflux RND transporter permease subunit [Planctomycetota bacterium]|nr:efflux RND transporter permease subunit [Planctomycetota bacterium]
MNIPRYSVRNPIAVNLMMWLVILGGIFTWFDLLQELFPNSEPERVQVAIRFPGATPEEVEKLVTRPVEKELMGIDDVKEVRADVFEALTILDLQLKSGGHLHNTLSESRTAIGRILPNLPRQIEKPEIAEFEPQLPVINVIVYGDSPEENLRRVAREVREDLLERPGITKVLVAGVREREIWIEIQPGKLDQYGISLEEIGRVLSQSNLDLPGGQLKSEQGNIRVRTLGELTRAMDIETLVIRGREDGTVVRLRDVARVRETFEDRVGRGRYDSSPAVALTVLKTPDQDAVQIAREVRNYVKTEGSKLGGSIRLAKMTDLAKLIDQRLELMKRNGRQGLILVVIVLAFFLDLRVAFWVALGIPISFLGTFILMSLLGASINLISIFGLILVLGIIVDDAIVIGESVFSRIRSGNDFRKAAIEGTNQVAVPVLAAVLTSIMTFIPLLFIDGNLGTMMAVLPVVVIAALVTSLLEAFVILPCHLAHMHEKRWVDRVPWVGATLGKVTDRVGEGKVALFERIFPGALALVLRVILRWRYVALAVFVALLVASVGMIQGGIVPIQYFQEIDAETVAINLEMAAGTPEEQTLAVIQRIEKMVQSSREEVSGVFSAVGITFEGGGRVSTADPATVGQVIVELSPVDERQAKGLRNSKSILAQWRRQTGAIPGVKRLRYEPQIGGPSGADIEIRVEGDQLPPIEQAIEYVKQVLQRYDGVGQINDDLNRGKIEARLELRDVGRLLGLTTRDLAFQLRHSFFGFEVQEIQGENDRVTLRVLFPRSARSDLEDLGQIRISTRDGGRPSLEEVATVEMVRGFGSLHRYQGRRMATVRAEVDEDRANTRQVTRALEESLADVETRFPGTRVRFSGKRQRTLESVRSLAVGFPVALFGIYSIIAILFGSYLQPLIVMLAIPFSFVGAIFGHYLLGFPFTVFSMIGFVALAGVVVNDSLILVDFINRARQTGIPVDDAAVEGARARFRAITLTSITTICGLWPLLMERSYQAQFLIPMGISIVYGLGFATVVTLILIPVIYTCLADIQTLFRWLLTGVWVERLLASCICGRQYHVPPHKAGKKFRCIGCGEKVAIPDR